MKVELFLSILGFLVPQIKRGRSKRVQKCRCRKPVRSAADRTTFRCRVPLQIPPSLVIHVRLSGADAGGSLLPGTPSSKIHPSSIQSRRRGAHRLAAKVEESLAALWESSPHAQTWSHSPECACGYEEWSMPREAAERGPALSWVGLMAPTLGWLWQ